MGEERKECLLDGYRVLDLTDEKGLLCGKLLGELGADVIKVEKPGGDAARNIGPFYKDIPHPEKSLHWFAYNLNKRSITLDIERPHGAEIFKRLVKTADIVVESFQPGYLDSVGLGYESLKEINPGIILTSITPFGQTGPYAHYKGSDVVGWAMGGMMNMCGNPDRPPLQVTAPQAYLHGSLHAALGTMVALYHREMSGEGQRVDASVQASVVWSVHMADITWELMSFNATRMGDAVMVPRGGPPLFVRFFWQCKDGYVTLFITGGAWAGAVESLKALVNMANRDGMAGDLMEYDWTTVDISSMAQEEYDRVAATIGKFLRTKTKAELFKEAVEKGIMLGPLNDCKDVVENEQLAARGYWVEVQHQELGEAITYPGSCVIQSETPWRVWRQPPLIGEHNEEIYGGELGMTKDECVILKQAGVI